MAEKPGLHYGNGEIMEILVTGASGFIGSNLCKALCEEGHGVHAFYRPRPDNEVPALIKDLEVVHHQGDITDFEFGL